jgi:Zn-dependent protease with chaperone function
MRCTACKKSELKEIMTKQGVRVDYCPHCKGVWLDKGEIYFFTSKPDILKKEIQTAFSRSKPSVRLNPKTMAPLVELSLFDDKLVIDYCVATGGIWLDAGELKVVAGITGSGLSMVLDPVSVYAENAITGQKTQEENKTAPALMPQFFLPNLALVSGMTLFTLYAMLTAVLYMMIYFRVIGAQTALIIGFAIAALQFIFSPFILDLNLRWFYKIQWVEYSMLPEGLSAFITRTCGKEGIKLPKIGIIPDGAPNAFTYGHTPNNARIVITQGILNLLEPDEASAVAGHEIGHIVHWDFLVMTVAYIVPLLLYYVYRVLIRVKSGKNSKSSGYTAIIAFTSYLLYLISEYIVLFFSRVREFYADRFSGASTKDPSLLASALVKIGYGLTGRTKEETVSRESNSESLKALGIFDSASARSLAVTTYSPGSMGGAIDKDLLKNSMKWDLWNPWAAFYELSSTHPLIAKRLIALSRQSQIMGKEPFIVFNEQKPESYWDEFFEDLFISWLPFFATAACIGAYFLAGKQQYILKLTVMVFGLSYLARTFFSYNSSFFAQMNIASLLKKIKVSAIRPVPCDISGTIIGRGVPGLIWSEDFVLQDKSGIIYLDYNQPLAIWNFFFGLLRSAKYQGKEVKIKGWYRRSPVPYIEIKEMECEGETINCYAYNAKIIFGILTVVAGAFWLIKP